MSQTEILAMIGGVAAAVGPICVVLWAVGKWGFNQLRLGQREIMEQIDHLSRRVDKLNSNVDDHSREIAILTGWTKGWNAATGASRTRRKKDAQ